MAFNTLQSFKALFTSPQLMTMPVRCKAKKAGTSTRNPPDRKNSGFRHPKGFRKELGEVVEKGTVLFNGRFSKLEYHPGLNVGFGARNTLFAMEKGIMKITVEKCNLNWKHSWVQTQYAGQEGLTIYKKHIHVIPEEQHTRFKLIDEV